MLSSKTESLKIQVQRQLDILFMFVHILLKSEMQVKRLGRQGD